MKDVVFAMELRGGAAPVEGKDHTLSAKTGGRGPHGETVTFVSQVVLNGATFNETGNIDYTGYGTVTFETVGVGHLGPSPIPGHQWGAVIWRITAGEGAYAEAQGYITSNFTVSAEGEVVDNHYVRMVLP